MKLGDSDTLTKWNKEIFHWAIISLLLVGVCVWGGGGGVCGCVCV